MVNNNTIIVQELRNEEKFLVFKFIFRVYQSQSKQTYESDSLFQEII